MKMAPLTGGAGPSTREETPAMGSEERSKEQARTRSASYSEGPVAAAKLPRDRVPHGSRPAPPLELKKRRNLSLTTP